MELHYCHYCRRIVLPRDIQAGVAGAWELKQLCTQCFTTARGALAVANMPVSRPRAERVNMRETPESMSRSSTAIMTSIPRLRNSDTPTPRNAPKKKEAPKTNPLPIMIGSFAAVLVLGFFLIRGGKSETPKAETETRTARKAVQENSDESGPIKSVSTALQTSGQASAPALPVLQTPAPLPTPPAAAAPAPVQVPVENATPASPVRPENSIGSANEAIPPAVETKTKTQRADEAFDILRRFEGLAADDKAGRIQRLEAFVTEFDGELVAARARVMLRDLKAPPPPAPVAKAATAAPAAPGAAAAPAVPADGAWINLAGPFTFEDGNLNDWNGDSGAQVSLANTAEGRCLRVDPSTGLKCTAWHRVNAESKGLRFRFKCLLHNMSDFTVLLAQLENRPKSTIKKFPEDQWIEFNLSADQVGVKGSIIQHIEIGGNAKGPDSYILLDDLVWEHQ